MGTGMQLWMLLAAMNIPRAAWPLLLVLTHGIPLADAVCFENLMAAIQRQGHIAEHTHSWLTEMDEGMRRPSGTS